jgi:hypothetical protein
MVFELSHTSVKCAGAVPSVRYAKYKAKLSGIQAETNRAEQAMPMKDEWVTGFQS